MSFSIREREISYFDKISVSTCRVFSRLFDLNIPRYFLDYALMIGWSKYII